MMYFERMIDHKLYNKFKMKNSIVLFITRKMLLGEVKMLSWNGCWDVGVQGATEGVQGVNQETQGAQSVCLPLKDSVLKWIFEYFLGFDFWTFLVSKYNSDSRIF